MATDSWFTVDREGLRAQLADQPKGRPLWELWQNAVDESVTEVSISLTPAETRGVARLLVTDDSPDGFADLADSWTFFKASKKAGDPEKRGRFNTGEKMVLAACVSATITSTKGRVTFAADGTRKMTARTKSEAGSIFDGLIRMTKPEIAEALDDMRRVLVPNTGITLTINGEPLLPRDCHRSFVATLETRTDFRATRRVTRVEVHDVAEGETPTIYEMGIPVVEHDGRWHINVFQKVPLNADRDNVTPGYLRALRTVVLDNTADDLTNEDANSTWVADALPHASDAAVVTAITTRFGDKRVAFDPSDPEANKQALDKGYTVIHGRTLSKQTWEAVRRTGAILPAGRVLPSGVPTSPDGKPPVPEDQWTDAMHNIARYTREVGEHLLDFVPQVEFDKGISGRHGACWGGRTIAFNLTRLGNKWPANVTIEQLDSLLIHEFAHHVAKDHLSSAFYDECCRLGAKLRTCKAELR